MSTAILPTTAQSGKPYQPPPRREQVLIVVHPDGFIECYAERHVDCRIMMMPQTSNAECAILAEQYLETRLPECYRKLYWPGNKRASVKTQVIRPINLLRRQQEIELLASIDRAGEILRGGAKR